MKRCFQTTVVVAMLIIGCQSAPPPPPASPADEPVALETVEEPAPIGMVTVNASALNMRSEPSMDGEILTQIKRGGRLPLLEAGESWMKVQLPDGRTAWAASRFLLRDGEKAPSRATRRRGNCPPDSDFAFATAPTPTFSDSDQHGEVVVEAFVGTNGNVKSTKVIRNSTGDEALAFQTEREIRSATFIAPVRNCVVREFIFTYRRTY